LNQAKPFPITKRQVWEAYKRVKANRGGAGVDEQTLLEFDEEMENNLYKLWNRLASGSYHPPPVKRVEIPKADEGVLRQSRPNPVDARGAPPHTGKLGGALYRAVAEGTGTTAGREAARAYEGHSARGRHQSAAGQPVPALCFRRMDAADLPGYSIREVRG
jgi:hypothetical protein